MKNKLQSYYLLISKFEIFNFKLRHPFFATKFEFETSEKAIFMVQVNLVIRGLFSANSLIHIVNTGLKCQISSQNVSFHLRIHYLQSKIAG
jgi:hypothetical protein